MEGGPKPAAAEVAFEVNLLEVLGDRVITIFGITGPIKELGHMCPKNLNAPDVSVLDINVFVVKAANESGMEIPPELEPIFTQVTEEYELDRKFTIAETKAEPKLEVEHSVPIEKSISRKVDEAIQPTKLKPVVLDTKATQLSEIVSQQVITADEQRNALASEQLNKQLPQVDSPVVKIENTKVIEPPVLVTTNEVKPESSTASTASTSIENIDVSTPLIEVASPEPNQLQVVAPQVEVTEDERTDLKFTLDELPEVEFTDYDSDTVSNLSEESLDIVEADWLSVLNKQPLEVYEDFTDALAILVYPTDVFDSPHETVESEPIPQIARSVAERLSEIDSDTKDLVAPILVDIIGALHGIQVLENKQADQAAIEQVQSQLEEICITLLDTLGIDYSEEDIKQFVYILMVEKFQPVKSDIQEQIDLENLGTREAKQHFSHTISSLIGVEDRYHLIGVFALLKASSSEYLYVAA